MKRVVGFIRVESFGDDSRVGRGDAGELFENCPRVFEAAEQAEIIAHHNNRVERRGLEFISISDGANNPVFQTAQFADSNRAGRIVYADDIEIFRLQIKRVSARAAADI